MYQVKAHGGGDSRFFDTTRRAAAIEQLGLIQDLREPLAKQQLELHYQPKYGAKELDLIGVEALLRWRHPVKGFIPPDRFMPLAKKTGFIIAIGYWVIDEACRQLQAWRNLGTAVPSVAVNLSALQLPEPGFVEHVRYCVDKHRIRPDQLILEITETLAMREIDASMRILRNLHTIGVCISIDDVGTGYSSPLHLRRLPATELKINRGFVQDLREGSEDGAIISAIIALSETLNLSVVAEGVETQQQLEFLTRVGCDALQGSISDVPSSLVFWQFRSRARHLRQRGGLRT